MQSKHLRVTTLALPKIAVRQLDALAVLEGRTRSALAREAIADLLRRRAGARAPARAEATEEQGAVVS